MGVPHILIVDDDKNLVNVLQQNLCLEGYEVEAALDGAKALDLFPQVLPDLVILDLMMPGLDGFGVLAQIRRRFDVTVVPVLVLSAKHSIDEKTRALNEGADDYLTKPFEMPELLARINALLRRASYTLSSKRAHIKQFGDLCIDPRKRHVTLRGDQLHLTPTEYALLLEFATHPDRVLRHKTLLQQVWGPTYHQEIQYLHVYVQRLRSKIEKDPSNPCCIVTVPGVGYQFCSGGRVAESG